MEENENHYFFRESKEGSNVNNKNREYLSWEFFKKTNGKSSGTTWIRLPRKTRENFLDESIKYIKEKYSIEYKKIEPSDYYIKNYKISFEKPIVKPKYQSLLEVTRKNTNIEVSEKSWIKVKYNYIISNKVKDKDDILNMVGNIKEFTKLINFLAPEIVKKIYYMNEYNKLNDNIFNEHKNQIEKIFNEITDLDYFKRIKSKNINNNDRKDNSFFVVKENKEKNRINLWKLLIQILIKYDYFLK